MRNPNRGVRPSVTKAIKEKCRDCMAYYVDGRRDCEMPKCPLYFWMVYGKMTPDRSWISRPTPKIPHISTFPEDET